jgi:hypothetical protein
MREMFRGLHATQKSSRAALDEELPGLKSRMRRDCRRGWSGAALERGGRARKRRVRSSTHGRQRTALAIFAQAVRCSHIARGEPHRSFPIERTERFSGPTETVEGPPRPKLYLSKLHWAQFITEGMPGARGRRRWRGDGEARPARARARALRRCPDGTRVALSPACAAFA